MIKVYSVSNNSEESGEGVRFNNLVYRTEVLVFGNPFLLIKHPNNLNPKYKHIIQIGDTISNGYLNSTTLWLKATCVNDKDINNINSWLLLDHLEVQINFQEQ